MLLLMIERGMPIDMVLYADTGMEFPEMYAHIAKLDAYLYEQRGIHITILRHPKGFEYLMFDEPKTKPMSIENRIRLGVPLVGNGWPGIRVRWCTGALKTKLIDKEVKRLKGELGAIHYIGIAADEAWRCKGEKYPLVEWGSPKPRHYRFAMIVGMTSAAYMRFTTGHLVGAVLSRGSESCGSYANITQNCGQGCWNWTVEPERSLAPAPWGNSKRTGALIA